MSPALAITELALDLAPGARGPGRVGLVDLRDRADDEPAGLHADEWAHAVTLAGPRRRDFVAGRLVLRALLHGGAPALLPDDRGAPRLPPGWVGSVSHKRGRAAAAVAPDDGWSLGVDLEDARPPRLDLGPRVLTPRELAALTAAELDPVGYGRAVTRAFSIKEAVYKAIDPLVRRYVGFREVELIVGADGGVGVVTVDPRLAGLDIRATWREHDASWVCTARARRR